MLVLQSFEEKEKNLAFQLFSTKLDILYIDILCDAKKAKEAVKLLSDGGYLILAEYTNDQTNSLFREFKEKENMYLVFDNGKCAIFHKQYSYFEPREYFNKLRISAIYQRTIKYLENKQLMNSIMYNVCVSVITYQHEKYIQQSLESIVSQKGNFNLHVLICDDYSSDLTTTIAKEYLQSVNRENFTYEIITNEKNIRTFKKYELYLNSSSKYDFVVTCDGDDYFIDDNKIEEHIKFLAENPRCIGSFNTLRRYHEKNKKFEELPIEYYTENCYLSISNLIQKNIIGISSAFVYRGEALRNMDKSIFDLDTGEGLFNIYTQRLGDFGHIKKFMTVDRIYQQGICSQQSLREQKSRMIKSIKQYNVFFSFIFDYEFSKLLESYDIYI